MHTGFIVVWSAFWWRQWHSREKCVQLMKSCYVCDCLMVIWGKAGCLCWYFIVAVQSPRNVIQCRVVVLPRHGQCMHTGFIVVWSAFWRSQWHSREKCVRLMKSCDVCAVWIAHVVIWGRAGCLCWYFIVAVHSSRSVNCRVVVFAKTWTAHAYRFYSGLICLLMKAVAFEGKVCPIDEILLCLCCLDCPCGNLR